MNPSTIVLHCHNCKGPVGSLNIDDISVISPENLVSFLVRNRIGILCDNCSCQHELED